jgi:hypothetical protein
VGADERLSAVGGARVARQALESRDVRLTAMRAGAGPNDPVQSQMNRSIEDFAARSQATMAITMAEQQAAAARIALTQAQREGAVSAQQLLRVDQARAEIQVQADAEARKAIASQQAQIAMGDRLVSAARMQGVEGVKLNAQLQEEMRLRQAGISVTTADSQARIQNAGAIAAQALRARDAAGAVEIRASSKDQLELIRLEKALTGDIRISSEERQRRLDIMRGENQAREQERQGLTDIAAATRTSTREIANANAELEKQRDIARLDQRGQYTARMTGSSAAEVERMRERTLQKFNADFDRNIRAFGYSGDGFGRYVDAFGNAVDEYGRTAERIAQDMSFKVAPGTFGGQSGNQQFTSITRQGYMMQFMEALNQTAQQRLTGGVNPEDAARAQQEAAQRQMDSQQRLLGLAQSQISSAISALQTQRSQIEDQRSKAEQEVQRLEQQFRPADRPNPYEHNPDVFFRTGTSAFRENDPLQQLIAEAQAQTRGVDQQIEGIDQQIAELERQSDEARRMSDLMSAGVNLQQQELSAMMGLVSAVGFLGTAIQQSDYARMVEASNLKTAAAEADARQQIMKQTTTNTGLQGIPVMSGVNSFILPTRTTNFAGNFATGGIIPAGSWGMAGEAGVEILERPTAVRGPAKITPVSERPIAVYQTIVANSGRKELTRSRGELAQRSAADLRRVMSR